jgi:transcriptional regulator GlxA family with amidase domain
LNRICPQPRDTLLVVGGPELALRSAAADARLIAWIRRAAPVVERVTSVCSGAFLLAEAGLFAGKHATTHWSACQVLAATHPQVTVEPNAIFVVDGKPHLREADVSRSLCAVDLHAPSSLS